MRRPEIEYRRPHEEAYRHKPHAVHQAKLNRATVNRRQPHWRDEPQVFWQSDRYLTASPGLPARIRHDWPLTPYDRSTLYGGGTRGYTDYPPFGREKAGV